MRLAATLAAALLLAPSLRAAPPIDWSPCKGDVPFLLGRALGAREAEFSGRPLLLCFVAASSLDCERLGAGAFRDPAVVKLARTFIPVLVDAEAEKEAVLDAQVQGFPTILFADAAGKEVGRLSGNAPPERVREGMQAALKAMGGVFVKRRARELERAAAALERSLPRKEWRVVIEAVLAIEAIDHEGPAMEAARAARKDAEAEARKRLADASALVAAGKDASAAAALTRILDEFDGLEAADEAESLLDLLESAPTGDAGDDGGSPSNDDQKRRRARGRSRGRPRSR